MAKEPHRYEVLDGRTLEEYASDRGYLQISEPEELQKYIDLAIQESPKSVEAYRSGNEKALMSIMGAVMKLSNGRANPSVTKNMLEKQLNG